MIAGRTRRQRTAGAEVRPAPRLATAPAAPASASLATISTASATPATAGLATLAAATVAPATAGLAAIAAATVAPATARLAIFTAALLLAAAPISAQPTKPMGTKVFNEVGIEQRLGERIPLELRFRNERGETVALGTYFGDRPVVLSLVYYRCRMLCPQVLEGKTGTFRTLEDMNVGREFVAVSVSIDHREGPADALERKTPYLREYDRPGAAENWHFLTGDSAAIAALAEAVGFTYVFDEKTGQFAHASALMIATPDGALSRYLYGIEYRADDLRFSLMEASGGKIGSAVDKLLLLCYHYDPTTGRYGVVITTILRAGGAVAALGLGGYMLAGFLRDRRRAAAAGGGGKS